MNELNDTAWKGEAFIVPIELNVNYDYFSSIFSLFFNEWLYDPKNRPLDFRPKGNMFAIQRVETKIWFNLIFLIYH